MNGREIAFVAQQTKVTASGKVSQRGETMGSARFVHRVPQARARAVDD